MLAAVDRSMGLGVTVEGPIAAHHRFVGVAQMADDTDPERFVRGFTSEDECLAWFSEIKGENEGPLWPEDGLLWPDVIVDLQAPAETAVRDASDAMLGDPYPFDEDHVIFA